MFNIKINLENSYDIIIDNKINYKKYISSIYNNKKIYIITDTIVSKLHLNKLTNNLYTYNLKVITIDAKEENKTLNTYNEIVNELVVDNITRDCLIIGFGGGIVGDVASFVASTILRGVKYISIPTTLLSQVDSSIGGKTGLNFNNKKNIIGSFYQPSMVLIDTSFLDSLSKEEYDNGLGEVIKCAFIKDNSIISLLKDNSNIDEVIYKCLLVKKHFVEIDPFDLNERMILNFGHTFGHVIELENNIKHGISVIAGMVMVIKLGIDLNITNTKCLDELINITKHLNITIKEFDYKLYMNKLSNDKKNTQKEYNFILLKDIGNPLIKKVERS